MRQRRLSRRPSIAACRKSTGRKRRQLRASWSRALSRRGDRCFIEGGASGPRENARIELEAGRHRLRSMSARLRSGRASRRSWRRSPPTRSKCRCDRIEVFHGSTNYLPKVSAPTARARPSWAVRPIVAAAEQSCEKYPRRGRAAASAARGRRDRSLRASAPRRTASCSAGGVRGRRALAADGIFSTSKRTYTYGTAMPRMCGRSSTGNVELLDYVVVDDVGRIINPLTLHGQIIGAVVQGLGGALLEEIGLRRERPDARRLARRLSDAGGDRLPKHPRDLAGAKSVAEQPARRQRARARAASFRSAACSANAVASALARFGVQPHELPLVAAARMGD